METTFSSLSLDRTSSEQLLLTLSFFFSLYALWLESRKDGFDEDRVFDLFFINILILIPVFLGIRSYVNWLTIYQPFSPVLSVDGVYIELAVCLVLFYLLNSYLTQRWSWSFFRVADNFSLFVAFMSFFYISGYSITSKSYLSVPLGVVSFAFFILFRKLRVFKLRSGYTYSVFLVLLPLTLRFFYYKPGYLFFVAITLTMSLVNLIHRKKKDMNVKTLPNDFITKILDKLLKKKKDLLQEEKLLKKQDPYLTFGRDSGNSEDMDEAILEDQAKEVIDTELAGIDRMKVDVEKAIAQVTKGSYGVCEVCGKSIDKARLSIFPEATRCFECAAKLEK